jgi:hypothetical protein
LNDEEETNDNLKIKNQVFDLNDICGACKEVEFSNVNSNSLLLKKGNYVLIPYTHVPLMRALEYTLCCQYIPGQAEFNVDNDNIETKNDNEQSSVFEKKDEKDNNNLKINKDQIVLNEGKIDKYVFYDMVNDPPFISPKLGDIRTWEYTEETEELGNSYVYICMYTYM